ncbi:MAG: hypothetical protein ONB32_07265 [candidate division KSB1 bacterium]|nr:hypothetical protein [candidate division KSB1 bacterium]MDZ7401716.1 hypothetical protein [candidate division KSB1 bacterium]
MKTKNQSPGFSIGYFNLLLVALLILIGSGTGCQRIERMKPQGKATELNTDEVIKRLTEKYGASSLARIQRGVQQVASLWTEADGSNEEFAQFCEDQFIADSTKLHETLLRYEKNLEQIYGLNNRMQMVLQEAIQVDIGPILPVDLLFANFDPFAHLDDDFFKTKLAMTALLNFPLYTLEQRLQLGKGWSREQWAAARLVQRFAQRVPGDVQQKISEAFVAADHYISNYNIHMGRLVTPEGERLFPDGLKLISHWGLRDELKAQYANLDGLRRQKLIQQVMERIIRQEIPQVVVDNPNVIWDPINNTVAPVQGDASKISNEPEPNTRYDHLLRIFRAEKSADPYCPNFPTYIERKFNQQREIPERQFEQLLISVLSNPVAKQVATLIEQKLGRKLEPFDIWYNGFKPRGQYDEAFLDSLVMKRYPTVAAFQRDLPNILKQLGFSAEKAAFLSQKINVDPARGSGHAAGAMMRSDNAHLRTRVTPKGMNYKGFNIAIHELGHNVEQVFSLNEVDYTLLQGVPNTAFTEAFAFSFQSRDLSLLGLKHEDPMADHLKALDAYWSTFEIAGVALVDMYIWHWMYDHPLARADELNAAIQAIAKEVWNKYYAPIFGVQDQILLAIYSHIIDAGLYVPDYPLGHIISFQIEQYLQDKNLATEMERMCRQGAITPEAWMMAAVGQPISTEPLIRATELALKAVK